jgi:hypothetical protein
MVRLIIFGEEVLNTGVANLFGERAKVFEK